MAFWRRQWHPTPELLPGKSHGWRSLVGCRPWGREESDRLNNFTFTFIFMHWRRKWQPTPVFLPGESQGWGAWWAAVSGVAQSRTRLNQLSSREPINRSIPIRKPDENATLNINVIVGQMRSIQKKIKLYPSRMLFSKINFKSIMNLNVKSKT